MQVFPPLILILAGPSITDYLQTLAAWVGVVGVLYTIWDIRRKNKENAENINILSEGLEETKAQTQLMKEGVSAQLMLIESLIRSIDTQVEQGREIVSHNKAVLQDKRSLRIKEIQPYFRLAGAGTRGFDKYMWATLKNIGEKAEDLILSTTENSHAWHFNPHGFKEFEKDAEAKIEGNLDKAIDITNLAVELDLIFRDIDGNKYRQRIEVTHGRGIKNQPPQAML